MGAPRPRTKGGQLDTLEQQLLDTLNTGREVGLVYDYDNYLEEENH